MIKRKKELVEYARRLKLASLAEHMTEIIHEAQEKQPTYSEFLFSCLAKEVGERDRKSFLSRIKVAGLPARHTLDEYDFNRTEGLDGRQLRELRELDEQGIQSPPGRRSRNRKDIHCIRARS